MTSFSESPIVALSYFYDRLEPLGLNGTFTIATLATLAADVCAGPGAWETKFPKHKFPRAMAELTDRPETCLDLTFQHALLSLGYDLSPSRSVTVAKKLAGSELGWCAGAQLMTVSSEQTQRERMNADTMRRSHSSRRKDLFANARFFSFAVFTCVFNSRTMLTWLLDSGSF